MSSEGINPIMLEVCCDSISGAVMGFNLFL